MDLGARIALMATGKAPLPAYDRHMGFRLVSWSETGAVMETDVDASRANPTGVLHGGVLAGLMDSAMGITVSGLMGPDESCTNTDLQVRFLRGTTLGTTALLRATARVIKRGRRVVAMECDVHDARGALIARASSTFLVLPVTGPA